jgi:hypothetical protein
MAARGRIRGERHGAARNGHGSRVNERQFERTCAQVNAEEEAHNGLYLMHSAPAWKNGA